MVAAICVKEPKGEAPERRPLESRIAVFRLVLNLAAPAHVGGGLFVIVGCDHVEITRALLRPTLSGF